MAFDHDKLFPAVPWTMVPLAALGDLARRAHRASRGRNSPARLKFQTGV